MNGIFRLRDCSMATKKDRKREKRDGWKKEKRDGDETFQSKLLTEFLRIFSTWQKWECENWWKECGSQIETEVSENHPFLQSNEFEIFAGRMDFISWLFRFKPPDRYLKLPLFLISYLANNRDS